MAAMKKTPAGNRAREQSPRKTACDILARIERGKSFADRILAGPLVAGLDTRDRNFVRELVLGVTRHRLRLDRILENCYNKSFASMEDVLKNILRTGVYQIMFMDGVPDFAAVNESVELATVVRDKRAGGMVNALLRRFLREGEPPFPADTADRLEVEYSHPRWLLDRWIGLFGPVETEKILRAGMEKHPVFIRAREGRIDAPGLAVVLAGEGFRTRPAEGPDGYLAVEGGTGLFDTAAFRDGLFTSQDPSAGMAVLLLDPRPGERVLDLCSAPGGKASQCAERMEDRGTVTAVDLNANRLNLVRETAERMGLSSIATMRGDARTFSGPGGRLFDRVLLDAPCTGTGVFSKRPDMKWRLAEEDSERLAGLQREMLGNAAGLVAPGGMLVYSTCTLEPAENEDVVKWFLDTHPEYTLAASERFAAFGTTAGCRILPHHLCGAGAFAAPLQRKNDD